jgi:hypothetical protein
MVDPVDLLRSWQDVVKQLGSAAGSVSSAAGQSDVVKQLVGPMQKQAELVEQALRRQFEFEREMAGRLLAPVNVLIDAMDQTASAMRTQSQAFDAASAAFKQASELLELQASLIDQSVKAMRDPAEFIKSAGGAAARAGTGGGQRKSSSSKSSSSKKKS